MLLFSSITQQDGLENFSKGKASTWSNMQNLPLLKKRDWISSNATLTTTCPNALANPLSKITSDNIPTVIQIDNHMPKCQISRFEEF